MLLKFQTNFTFPLISIVTTVSWEYKFIFPDFNSFNFKCVKEKTHISCLFSHRQAEYSAREYNVMTVSIFFGERVMSRGCEGPAQWRLVAAPPSALRLL